MASVYSLFYSPTLDPLRRRLVALALPAVVAALLVCILPLHRRQPPLPQPLRRQYQRPCLCLQIHCQLHLLKNIPHPRPPPPPRPLRCRYQRPFLCCQIPCQLVQNYETLIHIYKSYIPNIYYSDRAPIGSRMCIHPKSGCPGCPDSAEKFKFSAERLSENAKTISLSP